jgi:hypothetical protein
VHVACRSDAHRALTERYIALVGIDAHQYDASYDEARAKGPPYKLLVMGDAVDAHLALLRAALPPGLVTLVRGSPPFFVEVLHPQVPSAHPPPPPPSPPPSPAPSPRPSPPPPAG